MGEAASQAMTGHLPLAALEMDLFKTRGVIDAPDLEAAFSYGQADREDIRRVEVAPGASIRSLSVGDFVVEDGRDVHLCAPIGWTTPVKEVAQKIRHLAGY